MKMLIVAMALIVTTDAPIGASTPALRIDGAVSAPADSLGGVELMQSTPQQPSSTAAPPVSEAAPEETLRRVCPAIAPMVRRVGEDFIASADYDGDGKEDASRVLKDGSWLIDYASDGFGFWSGVYEYEIETKLLPKFAEPLPGDYNGDCKMDLGARDIDGALYISLAAADGFGEWTRADPLREFCSQYDSRDACQRGMYFFTGDFDGDNRADRAAKNDRGEWSIDFSGNGFDARKWDATYAGYGDRTALPVPGDYDGDRVADMAVKTSAGLWLVDMSGNGRGQPRDRVYPGFGGPNFLPVPADYDGDGRTDFATRDADNWYIDFSANGRADAGWDEIRPGFGRNDRFVPAPADYDGDKKADLASVMVAGQWLIDFSSNGRGSWDTYWDPDAHVPVGVGIRQLASEFDARWMSAKAEEKLHKPACDHIYARTDAAVWFVHEWFVALARMYRKTRDIKYADKMYEYASCMLLHRDDRHPGPRSDDTVHRPEANPLDQIRNRRGLPGWGARSLNVANLHRIEEATSALYARSLATFARLVLESPELQQRYGTEAIVFTNAALDTALFFIQEQFQFVRDGAYTIAHLTYPARTAFVEADCKREFDLRVIRDGADASAETKARTLQQYQNCKGGVGLAGKVKPYNYTRAFGMAFIEIARALDTPYYRAHGRDPRATLARSLLPLMVARIQRGVARDRKLVGNRYNWQYKPGEPDSDSEDFDHAGITLQFLELLYDSLTRMKQMSTEPILFDCVSKAPFNCEDVKRYANTFLYMTRTGDISEFVDGTRPNAKHNYECLSYSWLEVADRRVYDRCHEMVLRLTHGFQPSLTIGSHAALLVGQR